MSILLLGNKKKKDIVKNGLVLYLDARDFTNSPPTSLLIDKSMSNNLTYTTEIPYTESTWLECGLPSNVPANASPTVSNNSLTYTVSPSTTNGYCQLTISNCNFKPSSKYGVLIDSQVNTLGTVFKTAGQISLQTTVIPTNTTGICKTILTTLSSITTNAFSLYCWQAVIGGILTIRSMRVFELPVGSLIEWDFNNLTATQLNLKYPMVAKGQSVVVNRGNDAIPSGMAYIVSSGSNNNGSIAFDGVDDTLTIPNSSSFNFGGGDFTIAMSVTFKSLGNKGLLSKRNAWNVNDSFYFLLSSDNTLQFIYTQDGINIFISAFPFIPTLNKTYRVVLSRIGTSLKCYVNNILLGDTLIATRVIFNSTEPLKIGALNNNGTILYPSDITLTKTLLIYKGVGFTDSQIRQDYNLNR